MKNDGTSLVELYLEEQILNLGLGIVGRTAKKFELPKEEVLHLYKNTRKRIKRKARNRGLVYLLISTPFLAAGILSPFGGVILFGAILIGAAGLVTALGLFRLAV